MRESSATAQVDRRQAKAADAGVKAMIPVGRPFLDYVLTGLADAGYRRVCLVVGPEHDAIREYYTNEVRPRRFRLEFAIQREPRGTADAVAAAETFAAGQPFTCINSDNYYPIEALASLRGCDGAAAALFDASALSSQGNVPVDRIRRFAVADIGPDGMLESLLEKPDEQVWADLEPPIWVSMNCWRFTPAIFEACRRISPSPRGEYEIPDAVKCAIELLHQPFTALKIRSPVLDLTHRDDIAAVKSYLSHVKVCL